jgi:hypothetical protein
MPTCRGPTSSFKQVAKRRPVTTGCMGFIMVELLPKDSTIREERLISSTHSSSKIELNSQRKSRRTTSSRHRKEETSLPLNNLMFVSLSSNSKMYLSYTLNLRER